MSWQDVPAKRPNDTFARAMPIPPPPVTLTSQFDNDLPQLYRFDGKAGEVWEFVVPARAEMEFDPVLKIRCARRIVRGAAVGPAKKDRRLLFRVPADGLYFLEVADSQGRSGAKAAYRLIVARRDK